MSARAVREAFRAELDAAIGSGAVSAPRVETINRTVRNEDRPAEWIALEFLGASEEQISLGKDGERLFRERGTVFVHVLVKANTGDERAVEVADEIRALFRGKKIGGGKTTIESVSPPDTGDGDDAGRQFKATVDVVYRHELEA